MTAEKRAKIQSAIRSAHKIGGPVWAVPKGDYPKFEIKRTRKRK